MVVARKPGKLPWQILTREYDLEYGKNSLSIQSNSLKKYHTFVIIDDLLATEMVVNCVYKLIQNQKKRISDFITVVGLNKLIRLIEIKFSNSLYNFDLKKSLY